LQRGILVNLPEAFNGRIRACFVLCPLCPATELLRDSQIRKLSRKFSAEGGRRQINGLAIVVVRFVKISALNSAAFRNALPCGGGYAPRRLAHAQPVRP
jgi:hypothetical protein